MEQTTTRLRTMLNEYENRVKICQAIQDPTIDQVHREAREQTSALEDQLVLL
jgi:hypothetical protein